MSKAEACLSCGRKYADTKVPGCLDCKGIRGCSDRSANYATSLMRRVKELGGVPGPKRITLGAIVLYKLPDGPRAGEERPAIIVRWPEPKNQTVATLHVFADTFLDGERWAKTAIVDAAPRSDEAKHGHWRLRS